MITLTFQRLPHGEGLQSLQYYSEDASGFDLFAALAEDKKVTLQAGERALIPTGIAIALPSGFEGQIRPRSGLALHHGITVLNSPGTIDADYRGEIGVILINLSRNPFVVQRGARIAQLVVCAVERVALVVRPQLDETVRGPRGFGSTGRGDQEKHDELIVQA